MDITSLLTTVVQRGASDIFVVAGRPLCIKVNETIQNHGEQRLLPSETFAILETIYELADKRSMERLTTHGDDDFSFSMLGIARFRISAYRQRGSFAAVIRVVPFALPDPKSLNIPDGVLGFSQLRRGLMLVTGPSGSGKSTTLACIIDAINQQRNGHIITLEDPIEYLHSHKQCIVSQREIELDTDNYVVALRAALRQTPDVVFIGELRDTETISIAMTAAETGHLVISTLHTLGTANTVDRIIDVFPSSRQAQIRIQLSMVLQGVVSQQLVPTKAGGLLPVFEIMRCNNAIRNLIRESKTHQLQNVVASSAAEGMASMDNGLFDLASRGVIEPSTAVTHALAPELLSKRLGLG